MMPGEETFRQRKLGEKISLLRLQPGYESAQTFTKIYGSGLEQGTSGNGGLETWGRLAAFIGSPCRALFQSGASRREAIRQTMIHYYREEEEQVIRSILHNLLSGM